MVAIYHVIVVMKLYDKKNLVHFQMDANDSYDGGKTEASRVSLCGKSYMMKAYVTWLMQLNWKMNNWLLNACQPPDQITGICLFLL